MRRAGSMKWVVEGLSWILHAKSLEHAGLTGYCAQTNMLLKPLIILKPTAYLVNRHPGYHSVPSSKPRCCIHHCIYTVISLTNYPQLAYLTYMLYCVWPRNKRRSSLPAISILITGFVFNLREYHYQRIHSILLELR